jgi:hypothetical protein
MYAVVINYQDYTTTKFFPLKVSAMEYYDSESPDLGACLIGIDDFVKLEITIGEDFSVKGGTIIKQKEGKVCPNCEETLEPIDELSEWHCNNCDYFEGYE